MTTSTNTRRRHRNGRANLRRLLSGVALVGLIQTSALAHEYPEQKRILVSVEQDSITVVIAHEIRPGHTATLLNAAADANRNGRIDLATERLGAAQAIMPRLLMGLRFWIDGETVEPVLQELDVRLGAQGSQGNGLVGLARFSLPPSDAWTQAASAAGHSIECEHEVGLDVSETPHNVAVEFQVTEDLHMSASTVPIADNDAVTQLAPMHDGDREYIRVDFCHNAATEAPESTEADDSSE